MFKIFILKIFKVIPNKLFNSILLIKKLKYIPKYLFFPSVIKKNEVFCHLYDNPIFLIVDILKLKNVDYSRWDTQRH